MIEQNTTGKMHSFMSKLLSQSKPVLDVMAQTKQEELLDNATTIIFCKLCKIKYRRDELRRVSTDSMLSKFTSHLRKRGVFCFEKSLVSNSQNTEATSLLCDLCFMLLIAENQLMEISSRFAQALSIPHNQEKKRFNSFFQESVEEAKIEKVNLLTAREKVSQLIDGSILKIEELPRKPLQWRLLICLKEISGLRINKVCQVAKRDVYLQVRINEFISKCLLISKDGRSQIDVTSLGNDENIPLNFLRVHYFLTLPRMKITKFLEKTEIEIRITDGPDFALHEPLAVGKFFGLRNFQKAKLNEVYEGDPNSKNEFYSTKIETFHVDIYSKHFKRFQIKSIIGIKRDYDVRNEQVSLKVCNGILFPEESFYNCDPLPETWIEIFKSKSEILESQANDPFKDQGTLTLPIVSLEEEERRIVSQRNSKRERFKHLESKLYKHTASFQEKVRNRSGTSKEIESRNQSLFNTSISSFERNSIRQTMYRPKSVNQLRIIPIAFNAAADNRVINSQISERTRENQNDLDSSRSKNSIILRNIQAITKMQQPPVSYLQNLQVIKQRPKKNKALKKINSTVNFHQKMTDKIQPYLLPSQQKAVKEVVNSYRQSIAKDLSETKTQDMSHQITQDILKSLEITYSQAHQTNEETLQSRRKKIILKKMLTTQRSVGRLTTLKRHEANNQQLL